MFEQYVDMDLNELIEARNELNDSISNEKIWLKNSFGSDRAMHSGNIAMLTEELEYVLELIEENS